MKEESGRQGNDQDQSEGSWVGGKGWNWSWSDRNSAFSMDLLSQPPLEFQPLLSLSSATQLGTQGLHRQQLALPVVSMRGCTTPAECTWYPQVPRGGNQSPQNLV